MSDNNVAVVDVWYHGEKFEVPRGSAPGWGLRIFFNVEDDEDLWVLDSSSSVKTKIELMGSYYVSHWDRFFSISKKVVGFKREGPRVVHIKSGDRFDMYVDLPSKWAPHSRKVRQDLVKYRVWLSEQPGLLEAAKKELKGKVLGTWHSPKPGFGDVLLSIANE